MTRRKLGQSAVTLFAIVSLACLSAVQAYAQLPDPQYGDFVVVPGDAPTIINSGNVPTATYLEQSLDRYPIPYVRFKASGKASNYTFPSAPYKAINTSLNLHFKVYYRGAGPVPNKISVIFATAGKVKLQSTFDCWGTSFCNFTGSSVYGGSRPGGSASLNIYGYKLFGDYAINTYDDSPSSDYTINEMAAVEYPFVYVNNEWVAFVDRYIDEQLQAQIQTSQGYYNGDASIFIHNRYFIRRINGVDSNSGSLVFPYHPN